MPRTFNGSSDYVGFTPVTWESWTSVHCYSLAMRTSTGALTNLYYAGPSGGAVEGNLQLGVDTLNDIYFGCNAASTSFAGTFTANTIYSMGSTKATGTATPRADYAPAPHVTWQHGNHAATLANPATTASAIEEVGRWNATARYWNGEVEWVGVWGRGPQWSGNQTEGFHKIGPRFLPGFFHGCQRFWWFNGYVSDPVWDRSFHGANEIARSGTTTGLTDNRYPGLAGTTFNLVPGVL